MRYLTQLRLTSAMAALAFAIMLAPAAMAGGDQGGSKDKLPGTAAYTNYSSSPEGTATPCQTCYMGAGLAGTQNKAPAAVPETPRCDTCVKGS
jgi:hypothetical protein